MVDRILTLRILEILCQLDGITLAEHVLIDTLAIKSHTPFTTEEARENIRHAADKGWITKTIGMVGESRWSRTLAGKAAMEDLRHP